jgi:hypothetical protein
MILLVFGEGLKEQKAMKRFLILVLLLVSMPICLHAQSGQGMEEQPPIAQPLVREGDLAVKLADAFRLGKTSSEAEAESLLAHVGIIPRNGWIADYPVTPDIIGELMQSINASAEAKSLKMGKDEALQAFQDILIEDHLAVRSGGPGPMPPKGPTNIMAPDSNAVNTYYYDQGPPAVTYYPPPPDYIYLYTWVPYPFWWGWGYSFSGFYVLADFHRVVHVHGKIEVISNHFVDHRTNRIVRIDPLRRYNGRTFAGIGAPHNEKRFIYTGVRGKNEMIFRGSRERAIHERRRASTPPSHGGREGRQQSAGDRTPSKERRERQ